MNTNMNMCVTTGLAVAFLLAGCGSMGTTGTSEVVISSPNGFSRPIDTPPPIDQSKAEAGDSVAQFNLALKHDMAGQLAMAAEWYRKAADQGSDFGQWNLGSMYEDGKGVAQNDKLALSWYRKAANQGHNQAKKDLKALELIIKTKENAIEDYKKAKLDYENKDYQVAFRGFTVLAKNRLIRGILSIYLFFLISA